MGKTLEIPLYHKDTVIWFLVDLEDAKHALKYSWFLNDGYVARCSKRDSKYYQPRLHRELLKAPYGKEVDHINGNKLDNRKENLRIVSRFENSLNQVCHRKAEEGHCFLGVKRGKNSWIAQIKNKGKAVHLGTFTTKEEAALAYNEAAIMFRGSFARLNKVEKA